ncbi:lipid-binding putative hydrolase [Ancylomarina subtilis]|uniref:Lipid-binding putative hydrolase n=1 Tax=Ancylomarina subtilis TaxID=1639035 RepID=A0A4Q7VL65_9BACT|nr:lipid-binding protein [Ancylomarina subtilis]RZT96959.1 lipid-binding putative hydrolase [Ancylomarina subtilis]
MKKLLYILVVGLIGLTACNDDIEIWDSAVLDYSGTYVVDLTDVDGNVHHDMIEIYNTAANVENEVIIDDHNGTIELRSKFSLDGDFSNFKSKSIDFADLALNENAIADAKPETAPTGLDQTASPETWYIKAAITEGKILPKGMTTEAGNVADSIYMKVVLYSGTVNFKSASVPTEYRANPDVEEFEWVFVDVAHDATKDETVVISGNRYTGFPEDD